MHKKHFLLYFCVHSQSWLVGTKINICQAAVSKLPFEMNGLHRLPWDWQRQRRCFQLLSGSEDVLWNSVSCRTAASILITYSSITFLSTTLLSIFRSTWKYWLSVSSFISRNLLPMTQTHSPNTWFQEPTINYYIFTSFVWPTNQFHLLTLHLLILTNSY